MAHGRSYLNYSYKLFQAFISFLMFVLRPACFDSRVENASVFNRVNNRRVCRGEESLWISGRSLREKELGSLVPFSASDNRSLSVGVDWNGDTIRAQRVPRSAKIELRSTVKVSLGQETKNSVPRTFCDPAIEHVAAKKGNFVNYHRRQSSYVNVSIFRLNRARSNRV